MISPKWRIWAGVALLVFGGHGCTRFDPVGVDGREGANQPLEAGSLEERLDAVIRVHLTSDPVTLDPWLAEDGISLRILNNVMQGLVEYDLEGNLQPAMAESWKISKDGLRLEFTLRKNLRWSDGRPVKTEEFVSGFRHALSPRTPSRLAPLIFNIKNSRAIRERQKPITDLGVVVSPENPRVLVVDLEKRQPWFLHALTLPVAFPLRDEILRGNGGKWPDTAPVTGRYRIVERRIDRSIRLEPNPNHFSVLDDQGKVRVAELPRPIVLQVIQDDTTALNLFESGDLDILSRIPNLEVDRIRRRFKVVTDPFYATFFFSFNINKAPFNQVENRRAFAAAIDRESIAKLLGNGERASLQWVPDGLDEHHQSRDVSEENEKLPVTLKKALSAVKARGFPGQPPVELAYDQSSRNQLIAEKVQSDILKALGLSLALRPVDWKTHVRQLGADSAPVWRFGWMAPFRDPISHLQAFTSADPNNHARYSNPEYDALVEEISTTEPGDKRSELLARAQKILVEDDAIVVPIFHAAQTHATRPRVLGFRVNAFGTVRFDQLKLIRESRD
jgi:oligopeptide transport system substrate-binding protein